MSRTLEMIEKHRERVINGPIGKTLLWLGFPLMMVQLAHVSYNIADTYWLSRYSDIAYAAPRQIWPFFMFLNALIQGLGAANMALISQAVGAKDYDYAKRVIANYFSTVLIVGTITTSLFILLGPIVYKYLVAVPIELYGYTIIYSNIIAIDLYIAAFSSCYGTIFQAIGDTRTPARAGIISSLLNIILDPILIFGIVYNDVVIIPKMGIAGAAWATVISRFIGFIIIMRKIYKEYTFLRVRPTLRIDRDWVARSFRIGTPVAVMMMTNSLAFMFQNRLVNEFGAYVTAAFAIGFILMDLADAALWGFTFSVSTMVGQAIGAGLKDRARKIATRSMLYIGISTFIGSMLVLNARVLFINAFTEIAEIAYYADQFVLFFSPTLAFFAIFFIGMSIGRGSGHTYYPTLIGIIRLWGLRIGLGYLLAFVMNMGTTGLWISMALSNFVAGIAIIPWAIWGNWTTPVIKKFQNQ